MRNTILNEYIHKMVYKDIKIKMQKLEIFQFLNLNRSRLKKNPDLQLNYFKIEILQNYCSLL